ncbi:MAG: restriction endonuclease subunit S, partial [Bacteroidota bacterium]
PRDPETISLRKTPSFTKAFLKKIYQSKRRLTHFMKHSRYMSESPIEFVSNETYKNWMKRGFPRPGDIFFVTEGHTMGFVAINNRTDEFALAQRMLTLQPAIPFNTKFFFYYMRSNLFQKLIRINATGAAAVGIKGSKFKSLPIPFPSLKEQNLIVKKLDIVSHEMERLRKKYQAELDSLIELKKSLLQKAFTGELTQDTIAV